MAPVVTAGLSILDHILVSKSEACVGKSVVSSNSQVRIVAIVCLFVHWIDYFCIIIHKLFLIDSLQLCALLQIFRLIIPKLL